MVDIIISQIHSLMTQAREVYHVDPTVFLAIYFAGVPVFYFSLYKTIRAAAGKVMKDMILWSTVFLATCIAPFVYVIFFGQNIPWWVYLVIAVIVAQSVYSLVMRLRTPAETKKADPPSWP